MEDPKNIKDDKKEKESPELKEELTEEEAKSVDGGIRWGRPLPVGKMPHWVPKGIAQDADHDSARLID